MLASVIVSTYNRPDTLERVLHSLDQQTSQDFEVVVADDGSSEETSNLIKTMTEQVHYPLHHIWQEDHGFQAAAARNKAVAASRGDYLIFLDGDCLVRPDFIQQHLALAESGRFVPGNRAMLTQSFTENVLEHKLSITDWSLRRWLLCRWQGGIERILPFIRLWLGPLRKLRPQSWHGVKTCNLGIWRSDFVAVNGFDEAYIGWGHEDADLAIRLIRAGITRKDGRFAVPVIHLWHRLNDRSDLTANENRLEQVLQAQHIQAQCGLSQYSNPAESI